MRERERERVCVCVRACMRERERERGREHFKLMRSFCRISWHPSNPDLIAVCGGYGNKDVKVRSSHDFAIILTRSVRSCPSPRERRSWRSNPSTHPIRCPSALSRSRSRTHTRSLPLSRSLSVCACLCLSLSLSLPGFLPLTAKFSQGPVRWARHRNLR